MEEFRKKLGKNLNKIFKKIVITIGRSCSKRESGHSVPYGSSVNSIYCVNKVNTRY